MGAANGEMSRASAAVHTTSTREANPMNEAIRSGTHGDVGRGQLDVEHRADHVPLCVE